MAKATEESAATLDALLVTLDDLQTTMQTQSTTLTTSNQHLARAVAGVERLEAQDRGAVADQRDDIVALLSKPQATRWPWWLLPSALTLVFVLGLAGGWWTAGKPATPTLSCPPITTAPPARKGSPR